MTALRWCVGVDPGKTGAVAMFDGKDRSTLQVERIPTYRGTTDINTAALVKVLRAILPPRFTATIERQGTRPGESRGVALKIGRGEGVLIGILAGLGCRDILAVEPSKWKKVIGVTSDKQSSIRLARSRFTIPESRGLRDGPAEAMLLALYDAARRTGHPAYTGTSQ